MKKFYLIGCLVSAVVHKPLLNEKEYVSYGLATAFWPIPVTLVLMYLHYSAWGNYKHSKKFPNQTILATEEAQLRQET